MFFRNAISFLSLALAANAQLSGQTVFWKTVITTGNGNCLTATKNADGAAVVIQDCGTNATQLNSWVVPNGESQVGTLQIFGDKACISVDPSCPVPSDLVSKCLDVTNGADADGTLLQIWTCATGNTNQMWIPVSDQSITWSGKNKCVDLTNGNLTNGNQVQIWDCDFPNDNQKWNAIGINTPKSFVLSLKENPSLCVTASANAVGAKVVIDHCSPGSTAQTFSDPSQNGQMVIYDNLCVSPVGNVVNDGTPLILSTCVTGDAAQGWSHLTGPLINNFNEPKTCLDLTNSNQTAGNQLQTWSCDILTGGSDNPNQDWTVSNTF
ncbi:ricin B lectin domain-containing protein [Mycena galericulata]|nr:ricin B lectin domain-containing protein [Mycena galericulata]